MDLRTFIFGKGSHASREDGLCVMEAHVGSSLENHDYHDVDLRCMLPDDEYDRLFESDRGDGFLLFLNAAISEWIASRTGLPIDFQFQRATEANATFKGRRNAVGH